MKKSLLYLAFLLYAFSAKSQVDTVWTKALGGSAEETTGTTMLCNLGSPSASIDKSVNGFLYITTSSNSSDGYLHSNKGGEDVWIIKMTNSGDTVWTKSYGGSSFDRPNKIIGMPDGGCVVVGRTSSSDFDFVGGHGMGEGFLIRLDSNGNQKWKKQYGGTEDDFLYDVVLSNGGLVVVGETGSINGDLSGTGSGLAWVMKVDSANGNMVWSKTVLGPNSASADFLENFFRIIALSDGSGYIAAGYTSPNALDGNTDDIFYAKISLTGTAIWTKKVGSTAAGDYPGGIIEGQNGEFYIAGKLASSTGADVTSGYYGGSGDVWLLKFNAAGTKIWDKHYGGTNYDFAFDIKKDVNNSLYIAGFTRSTDNQSAGTAYGNMDYWLLKTDTAGAIQWTKRAGGSQNDVAMGLTVLGPNSVVMSGKTLSSDLCVHGNNGGQDLWIVKYDSNTTMAVIGSVNTVCLGGSTGTMTLSGLTGSIVKWQKRLNNGAWEDIAVTTDTYSETPLVPGIWEYRVVANNGTLQYSSTKTITVLVTNGGAVAGSATICSGLSAGTLTLYNYSGSVIKWQSSVSPFTTWIDVDDTTITLNPGVLTETTYYKAILQNGSCSVESSDSAIIQVNVSPTAQFTYTANGLTVDFVNQSTNATSYLWNFAGGSATSDLENPSFTYPISGEYTVELTVMNGNCSDNASQTISLTNIGVEEPKTTTLKLYPIPTMDVLTIEMESMVLDNAQISIFDITGKLAFTQNTSFIGNKTIINISSLQKGVYIIKITNNQQAINRRIIVE